MSAEIKFAVRSEIGNVRTNNEDNFFCNGVIMTALERERPFFFAGVTEAPAIFAVCDGMGGEDCGEVASLTAVETLREYSPKILRNLLDEDEEVSSYAKSVNKKLLDIMRAQRIRTGTTLVLSVVGSYSFRIYNIGDSRGFRIEDGRLLRVTDDHTVAEEKMRAGIITAEQAEKSYERHMLTRFLGDDDDYGVIPDASGKFSFETHKGGMLCSDGLTDMLSLPEISRIMRVAKDPSEAVNILVDSALKKGGRDNITCIVFQIADGE